ncbi:MAG: RNA-guided endonuclease TnpB family protein [Bacteroidota bacterium]|nr:RNA-guided endonuclease TnpB family protein [Bacteroidota bacterium]
MKGNIQVKDEKIKLPKLGWVKLTEKISVDKIKYVVISRTAKRWFISLSVSFEPYKTLKKRATIGVDLGVKVLATLSDGKTFENRKPYAQYKRKLKLAQRHLSKLYRKGQEQTKNYSKQLLKVQRLHYRISCIRNDSIHRLTTYLAKNHSQIAIEDLNVRGMSRNHKLASAILDGGFYEFRRQLEYKTKWYGSELIIANRFYPSTKTCSHCGSIQSMSLNQRVYNCPNCKISIDRDLNAAINLENILAKNAHVCAEDETSQDCASDHPVKHDSAEILNKCGTFTGLN